MTNGSRQKARRKARQASAYRKTELLLCELMAMTERIPKHAQGLQVVGTRAVGETLDALAAIEFALNAPGENARLGYIGVVIHSMTIVRTCCRSLYAYSRKDRQEPKLDERAMAMMDDKGAMVMQRHPMYGRVISHAQYVMLLRMFSEIGFEIGRWQRATEAKRSQQGTVQGCR